MFLPGISNEKLISMKKGVPGDLKMMAVIRLYVGDDNGWSFKEMGCLFLIIDRTTKSPVLSLVNLKNDKVIWQHELYTGCKLMKLNRFFLAFEGDEQFFGLSFCDVCDAITFHKTAMSLVGKNRMSVAHNLKKKGSNILKKFKKFVTGGSDRPQKVVISGPSNFKHSMHIGVVSGKGFVTENLPEEWKSIFTEAGISDEDMRDPEKAGKLMTALSSFQKKRTKKKKKRRRRRKKKTGGGGGGGGGGPPPPPPGMGGLSIKPSKNMAGQTGDDNWGNSGGGGNLLDEIKGKKLKSVDERSVDINPTELDESEKKDLMSMLKSSIAGRFDAMRGDDDDNDDQDDETNWDDAPEDDW